MKPRESLARKLTLAGVPDLTCAECEAALANRTAKNRLAFAKHICICPMCEERYSARESMAKKPDKEAVDRMVTSDLKEFGLK